MIRSLPSAYDHLCINLTHKDNIKTFDDVARHVKLEEDRLPADESKFDLKVHIFVNNYF